MKILLSSFGINENVDEKSQSPYYQMPPMRLLNNALIPDYSVLLLFRTVVMDIHSFEAVMDWDHQLAEHQRLSKQTVDHEKYDLYSRAVSDYIEAFRLLHAEGFLDLVDFDAILSEKKDILEKMLANDMLVRDIWIEPLAKSIKIWNKFARSQRKSLNVDTAAWLHGATNEKNVIEDSLYIRNSLVNKGNTHNQGKTHYVDEYLDKHIKNYLQYVNCNLVLSHELDLPFHDWADYSPFYERKFLFVGQAEDQIQKEKSYIQKLFEVVFPEYHITKPSTFMKIITDRRIEDLRNMICESIENGVVFDEKFARETFKSVFQLEQKTAKYRTIVSWATKPIDLIPGAGNWTSTIVDELASYLMERKIKKDFRWFYLLSDIADQG